MSTEIFFMSTHNRKPRLQFIMHHCFRFITFVTPNVSICNWELFLKFKPSFCLWPSSLFGAKPLPEPMLTSVTFQSNLKHFHWRKCIKKCRLQFSGEKGPGGDVLTIQWNSTQVSLFSPCSLLRNYRCFLNSLVTGRFWWNFRLLIFKVILVVHGWGIACEIALRLTCLDLFLPISQPWLR